MCGHGLRFALVSPPHRPEKDMSYSHRLAWYSHDDVSNISQEDDPPKIMDDAIDDNDIDRWDKAREWDRLMQYDDNEADSLKDKRQVWVSDLVYLEKSGRQSVWRNSFTFKTWHFEWQVSTYPRMVRKERAFQSMGRTMLVMSPRQQSCQRSCVRRILILMGLFLSLTAAAGVLPQLVAPSKVQAPSNARTTGFWMIV